MTAKPIYRMSSAGRCLRALSAGRLGYEPMPRPKYLDSSAEEGRWHEDRIIAELKQRGYTVHDRQKELVIDLPYLTLVGHIECVLEKNGKWRHLEVKSMGRGNYSKYISGGLEAFPDYMVQVSCYLTALGPHYWPGLYIVKSRDSGAKDEFDIHVPPIPFEAIEESLMWVEANARVGKLVGAQYDPTNFTCRSCQYRYLCLRGTSEVAIPDPRAISLESSRLLRARDQRIRKARELLDEAASLNQAASQWKQIEEGNNA